MKLGWDDVMTMDVAIFVALSYKFVINVSHIKIFFGK